LIYNIKEKVYLGTLSTRNQGFANILHLEDGRGFDIIPILLGKWIGAVN